jgi:hypothetical protein
MQSWRVRQQVLLQLSQQQLGAGSWAGPMLLTVLCQAQGRSIRGMLAAQQHNRVPGLAASGLWAIRCHVAVSKLHCSCSSCWRGHANEWRRCWPVVLGHGSSCCESGASQYRLWCPGCDYACNVICCVGTTPDALCLARHLSVCFQS